MLEKVLADWCRERTPYEVMAACQREHVPAGNMLRLQELLHCAHFKARDFFRELNQPTVGRAVETEGGPVSLNQNYAPLIISPAPLQGEHTRLLAKELLGLTDSQVDQLVASGDLEGIVKGSDIASA
ncbi:MAG: crotonobetainyl-CoA:carnitine CoA-transferase CaiB-like acyl-CoA transferase [Hyphomonas sp.]|jgi:crotonobetainyl-CoA:carnitine CoA-transferase CaiB-like acyl-CoA transferase